MSALLSDADVFRDDLWQMYYGERFALEGLLRVLQPGLTIEIGRAEGGSLRRIAAHSGAVHSFDLIDGPDELRDELGNVEFHTGDSAVQVPEALAEFGRRGRHVDFALVDGDHSSEGVRKDAESLLAADCCRHTVIVFHDAANDDVRAGLEAVGFPTHPKVALALLDFVPGYLVEHGPYRGHIWNGLGLVALGDENGAPIVEEVRFDAAAVARAGRNVLMQDGSAETPTPVTAPDGAPSPRVGGRHLGAVAGVSLLVGATAGAIGARRRH